MAETTPNNPEKLIPTTESEGFFSGIMASIRKVKDRVRNSISNILQWTKKTAKGSLSILFPQAKEIEDFLMGKKGTSKKEPDNETPSKASVAAAEVASSVATATA